MTAEYRSVQTRMWREDDWFQSLDTDARLLFIYLFTNPSASIAGIYRLPLRTIEFESGIPQVRVKELMAQFAAANKVHYADGVVWVVKMRENQLPGNLSPKVQVRLDKDVASIPYCPIKQLYLKHYGYPIDTVSIPTSTDTDTDTVTEPKGAADAVPTEPSLADRFHVLLAELKETKNKPAKLREIYVLCFGDADAPTFSRLGQVAKDVGGAGNLAQYLFQNVTRPPAGDVLAYIATTHKNRTNGGNGNGGAFVANGTGYVMPSFGGSER